MTDHHDAAARRHVISRSIVLTVPGTLAALAAGYALWPEPAAASGGAGDRVAFALRWIFVAFLPYAAVCLHILVARFAEGAHNPLLGTESEPLRIHCRVMQNTLEQLLWFALCVLALAAGPTAQPMRLVPVAALLFVLARALYWRGYLRAGTLGRAPGVQMTFTVNITLLVLAAVHTARGLAG